MQSGGAFRGGSKLLTAQRRSCCIQRRATFFDPQKPRSRTEGTESEFNVLHMFIALFTSEDVESVENFWLMRSDQFLFIQDHLVFLFRLKSTFLRSSLAPALVKSMRLVTWCGLRLGRILGGRAWCHQTLSQMFIYDLIKEVIFLLQVRIFMAGILWTILKIRADFKKLGVTHLLALKTFRGKTGNHSLNN